MMKAFVSFCLILLLLLFVFTGCRSMRDNRVDVEASNPAVSLPAALVQTEQAVSETDTVPQTDAEEIAASTNDFPTLPEHINDQGYPHEDVTLTFGWTDPYPDTEEDPDINFAQMSFDEAYAYYQAHGPFFQIRNAEGATLDLDMLLGARESEKTTMEIREYTQVTGVNWDLYQVPYSADFLFEASRDDRPAYYAAAWADFRLQVEGEHLGDVRLTETGAGFTGQAKSYETEKPTKYRACAQMGQRVLTVSCEEAVGFLLTRDGNKLTVLTSNECEVVITEMDMTSGATITLLTETVPAGTSWYVEDLTAPAEALKTGLLP